jgi:DNA-binding protein H-NS
MTVELKDLLSRRDDLERQIQTAKGAARAEAIARVGKLMSEHGLTVSDLSATSPGKRGAPSGRPVAPKYRDPVSGATWSGRGLKPKWLVAALSDGSKSVSDFAIHGR